MEEKYQGQFSERTEVGQVLVAKAECKGSHVIAASSANTFIRKMIKQGVVATRNNK